MSDSLRSSSRLFLLLAFGTSLFTPVLLLLLLLLVRCLRGSSVASQWYCCMGLHSSSMSLGLLLLRL
jgi:hypothetical protein